LLFLHAATSYGDAGAINGGVAVAAAPATRAAALASFGLTGFTGGFLGSLAVGLALNFAGGVTEPTAWFWGFGVMAVGSVVAAMSVTAGQNR
jgi:hypothetical protein